MIEQPLITNDPMGLAKLIVAIVLGTGPIYGLVIAFLRKGPNDAIAETKRELNGYGKRLTRVEVDAASDRQETGQLVIRMTKSEQDREGIRDNAIRVETRVSENERRIEKNQQAILDATHKIELQVASLVAKADVGKELRDGLERIADLMEKRDARRDRGTRPEVE
jgi:predicted  nucleic acid-binding Zn-ribbon protein